MSTSSPLLSTGQTLYATNDNCDDQLEYKLNEENATKYNINDKNNSNYNMSNNLRSEKEIMDFLDRYIFKLSSMDVLSIYLFNPLSMFLNISFIAYNMYKLFIVHDTSYIINGYNKDTDSYLLICAQVVTGFEFGGLCILFLTLFYIYMLMKKNENYAAFINLLTLLGSWSAFKLFYECRPSAIFEHVSTVIKNNSRSDMEYCQKLQKEIETLQKPVYDAKLKQKLRNELQNRLQSNQEQHVKTRGLKQFMTESAYGLVVLLLFLGLFIGILSLLLKLSQLNFITTKRIQNWTLLNWFYCLGFSNQLWNMVNVDQLKTFTIYEFLYTSNRNISELTSKKLKKMLYLDSLVKTILFNNYGWKGTLISIYMQSSYILQILIKNPYQSENPCTFEEYIQYNKQSVPNSDIAIQQEEQNDMNSVSVNNLQMDECPKKKSHHRRGVYIHHKRNSSLLEDVLRKTSQVMKEENTKWKNVLNTYLSDLKLESLTIKDPISEAQLFVQEIKSGDMVDDIEYNHIKININHIFTNLSYLFERLQDWLQIVFIFVIVTIMISSIVTSMVSLFYYHDLSAMNSFCEERLIWFALCVTIILIISLLLIFICHECKPDNETTEKLLRLNVALVAMSIIVTFCIFLFSDQPCVKQIAKDPHYHIIHVAVITNLSLLLVLLLPLFIHLLFHPFYIVIAILAIIGAATLVTDAIFTFCLIWFVIHNYDTFKERYQNYNFASVCDANVTVILVIAMYYAFNVLLCLVRITSTKSNKLSASKCIRNMTFAVYIILVGLLIFDDIYLTDTTCDFWQNNVRMYDITKYSAGFSCIFWCLTFLICLPANTLKLERIKQISDFLMYHAAAVFCFIFMHLIADLSVLGLSIFILYKRDIFNAEFHDIDVVYNCLILIIIFFTLETIFTVIKWWFNGRVSVRICSFMGYVAMVCLELLYVAMIIITCCEVFGLIKSSNEFSNVEYDILILLITVLFCGQFIGIVMQCFRRNDNTQHWSQMISHVSGTLRVCRVIFFTTS